MAGPRYFFAMFGDPIPPDKDTVESGIYHPDSRFAPFPVGTGDILLLYCTNSYVQHAMTIPGIGVTTYVDETVINYRYVPFRIAVPKVKLKQALWPKIWRNSIIGGFRLFGCLSYHGSHSQQQSIFAPSNGRRTFNPHEYLTIQRDHRLFWRIVHLASLEGKAAMLNTRAEFEQRQQHEFESAPLLERRRYRLSVDVDVDFRNVPRAKLEGTYKPSTPPPAWENDAEGRARLELQRRLIQIIADSPMVLGYLMAHAAEYHGATELSDEYTNLNDDRDRALRDLRLLALQRLSEEDLARLKDELEEHDPFDVCSDVFHLSFGGRAVSFRVEPLG